MLQILKNLDKLSEFLPDHLHSYFQFLEDFRDLMEVTFGFTLGSDFRHRIRMFQDSFHILNSQFGVSETIKMHIIINHIEDFVEQTGQPLGQYSEQEVESCHQSFDRFWSKYKVKNSATDKFAGNLLKTVLDYNSMHI